MTDVFAIAPATPRALAYLAVLGGLLLAIILLFAWFAYASQSARFEVSDEGLRIHSAMYGRTIAAEALNAAHARIVSLGATPELRPSLRTNGIGLPGYRAGWFRLRNGERALLFVTDSQRVVYLPTHEGYAVLLSARDPDGLLRALQARASSRPM